MSPDLGEPDDDPFLAPASALPGRGPAWGTAPAASRRARLLLLAAAAHPVLLVGCLYASWLSAWALLGHPPRPMLDDPKDFGPPVDLLDWPTWLLLLTLPLAMVGSGVAFLSALLIEARGGRRRVALVLAPMLAWVAALLLLRYDPGRVLDWFMD